MTWSVFDRRGIGSEALGDRGAQALSWHQCLEPGEMVDRRADQLPIVEELFGHAAAEQHRVGLRFPGRRTYRREVRPRVELVVTPATRVLGARHSSVLRWNIRNLHRAS
jgi:hypothetical protein